MRFPSRSLSCLGTRRCSPDATVKSEREFQEVVENKVFRRRVRNQVVNDGGRRVQRIGRLPARRQRVFRNENRLPDRGRTNVAGKNCPARGHAGSKRGNCGKSFELTVEEGSKLHFITRKCSLMWK